MAELHDLTAVEQGRAVRKSEVSAVELTAHYLDRVEALSADLGAFVTVTPERAQAAARLVDERMRDGADAAELSPLAGVPTAVKDLSHVAGVPTHAGSAVMVGFVPDTNDEVVERMAAAGMVSLGKTNTPEFGSPCYTEPAVAPPARTPYDRTRSAGGSSGGAAAAVAAGLVAVAHGSDGGGSIRIPASVCGLVGLKPSRGRVSGAPLHADVAGLSAAGPLARTVRDAAAFLDAVAGPAVGDPAWAPPLPAGQTYLDWCGRDPGRLRVGRFATPLVADVDLDPQCRLAYEHAAARLADLGHEVTEVTPPSVAAAISAFETVWAVSTCGWPVPAEREPELRPLTRWLRARGRAVTGPQFAAALVGQRQMAAATLRALAPYDVILTPTLASPPLPVGALRDDDDPAADFEAQKRFTPYTAAWNLTGMPAVSLPTHWTADGLPVGVMLAGRPAEEHRLLAVSAQLEAAAADAGDPWSARHPACW